MRSSLKAIAPELLDVVPEIDERIPASRHLGVVLADIMEVSCRPPRGPQPLLHFISDPVDRMRYYETSVQPCLLEALSEKRVPARCLQAPCDFGCDHGVSLASDA